MNNLQNYKSYEFPYPNEKEKFYDSKISQEDIDHLRSLARRVRDISQHGIQKERKELWKSINGLKKYRPPVFLRLLDLYWPEFYSWDNLKTKHPWARLYEDYLIKIIWQWDNIEDDFVTEAKVYYDTPGKFGKFIQPIRHSVEGHMGGSGAYEVDTVITDDMKPEEILTQPHCQ